MPRYTKENPPPAYVDNQREKFLRTISNDTCTEWTINRIRTLIDESINDKNLATITEAARLAGEKCKAAGTAENQTVFRGSLEEQAQHIENLAVTQANYKQIAELTYLFIGLHNRYKTMNGFSERMIDQVVTSKTGKSRAQIAQHAADASKTLLTKIDAIRAEDTNNETIENSVNKIKTLFDRLINKLSQSIPVTREEFDEAIVVITNLITECSDSVEKLHQEYIEKHQAFSNIFHNPDRANEIGGEISTLDKHINILSNQHALSDQSSEMGEALGLSKEEWGEQRNHWDNTLPILWRLNPYGPTPILNCTRRDAIQIRREQLIAKKDYLLAEKQMGDIKKITATAALLEETSGMVAQKKALVFEAKKISGIGACIKAFLNRELDTFKNKKNKIDNQIRDADGHIERNARKLSSNSYGFFKPMSTLNKKQGAADKDHSTDDPHPPTIDNRISFS